MSIFVKEEVENLIYIMNNCKQSHQQKCQKLSCLLSFD